MPDPEGTDRDALEIRRAALNSEVARQRRTAAAELVLAGIVTTVSAYLFFTAARGEVWWPLLAGAVVTLLIAVHLVIDMFDIRTENRIRRGDLEQLEFEAEMMAYEASAAERRAEKLLKSNERQLRRYYNLNLNQGRGVLVTGIGCVVVGIAVVGWTFYAVAQASGQTEAQIVIGAVGAVGTILINYVAAIYLKIHASAAESLTAFHARLTSIHELFLANLLMSRVSETRRDDALSTLAVEIAKKRTDQPKS